MSLTDAVAHDPSVADYRATSPRFRAGRNMICVRDQSVSMGNDSAFAHSPIEPS